MNRFILILLLIVHVCSAFNSHEILKHFQGSINNNRQMMGNVAMAMPVAPLPYVARNARLPLIMKSISKVVMTLSFFCQSRFLILNARLYSTYGKMQEDERNRFIFTVQAAIDRERFIKDIENDRKQIIKMMAFNLLSASYSLYQMKKLFLNR